ncbi:MAG: hypothetical protein NTV49_06925 [Kiritimatiellaeota bacterium]|nr:hypothetical protein [Kiritimatiellota bacterium]
MSRATATGPPQLSSTLRPAAWRKPAWSIDRPLGWRAMGQAAARPVSDKLLFLDYGTYPDPSPFYD